jgi:four helix bundle protein
MFLKLNHQKLETFVIARQFVLECYRLSNSLPSEERYGMITQIRRSAVSVYLNIAEGSSRKSGTERKRFYEISRGSIIEIDAALDIANDLGYLKNYNSGSLGETMINTFKLLSGLIQSESKN